MATMAKIEPRWTRLYETAAGQGGLFTTRQAGENGYSSQAMQKHLKAGRVSRLRHGIYRLVHFPAGDQEDLISHWLWSEQQGVFSHETALALYELSDALPSQTHMTLPASWQGRRLRVPKGVVLYHANIPKTDTSWVGVVPVTAPRRTIEDCIETHIAPDLVKQTIVGAKNRGLITAADASRLNREQAKTNGTR